MSNGVFNFNFLALLLSEILGGPKFTLGGPTPPGRPLAEKFLYPKRVFLIVFLISTFQFQYFLGYQGVPNLHQAALRSPEAPQRKNFNMRASTSTCLYLYKSSTAVARKQTVTLTRVTFRDVTSWLRTYAECCLLRIVTVVSVTANFLLIYCDVYVCLVLNSGSF